MRYSFYLWNITNPDEVNKIISRCKHISKPPQIIYEGAVPRLQEHGPYVYMWAVSISSFTIVFIIITKSLKTCISFDQDREDQMFHQCCHFRGHERKENITWLNDGKEVRWAATGFKFTFKKYFSFRNRRFWHFNAALSCSSCRESDRFLVPNVAYAVRYIS